MPDDIKKILTFIAESAAVYNNQMKWNEKEKLKSDMMKHRDRWCLVTNEQIRKKCIDLGMKAEDVETICSLHSKCIHGRQMIPQKSYCDYEFLHRF